MKSKNATRNALFSSIIALLLCVSMLVGTTFAWFTDKVESGVNTIAAGNLDVELYYSKTKDFTDKNSVEGKTQLFTDKNGDPITYWEPGVVAYTNLQVANEGTLALKYQLSVNFENKGPVDLSKALQVAVVTGGFEGDRAQAQALTELVPLESFALSGVLEGSTTSEVYGIVIYWEPTDDDNKFNMNNENKGKTLSIDLGVNLFATQEMYENDSFGEDYDALAPWQGGSNIDWYLADPDAKEFTIKGAEELAGLAAIVNGTAVAPVTTFAADSSATVHDSFEGKTIKLGTDVDLNKVDWTPIGRIGKTSTDFTYSFKGVFDGQDHTIYNLEVFNTGWAGVFGLAHGAQINNLKVSGVQINSNRLTGAVVGQLYGSIDNCHVENAVITVVPNAVEGGFDNGDKVGGIVGWLGDNGNNRTLTNCTATNVKLGAYRDVGGIAGYVASSTTVSNNKVNGIEIAVDQITNFYGNKDFNAGAIYGRTGGEITDTNNTKGEEVDIISTYAVDGVTYKKSGEDAYLYLVPTDYEGSTVKVAEGTTKIGNYAFAYNSNVKEVELASTVTDLGRGFDSSTVEKVVLNEGLTTISSRAFKSTTALKEVVISSSVTTIADNAFQKSGIKMITIPANVETIGETAFGSSEVETVIIEGNTSVQGYAFRGCPKLRTVIMKGDVTCIPSTLNGRNSTWFCNGESNNPNTSKITFYVPNETVADRVKTAMGAEAGNTKIILLPSDVKYISSAAELLAMSDEAFTGNNGVAESYTVMLLCDVDLQGADFSAMAAQRGDTLNFLGNGHTISNVNIISGAEDNTTGQAGMFYAYPNSTLNVSNLTLKNITVNAEGNSTGYAAAVIGYCEGKAVLNDVDVINAAVTGVKSSGALVGHLTGTGSLTATDCAVSGTVTLADREANGHYAGKYIGTMAGNTALNNCTADVTVGGNLNAANNGAVYGRRVGNVTLTVDGTALKVIEYNTEMSDLFGTISAMNSGDTLILSGGTYNTSGSFQVPAGVTIEGKAGENVVFHQQSAAQDNIFECAGDVTFRNITFESNRKGYAVADNTKNHDTNGDITIINCKFKGLAAEKNWGIYKNLNGDLILKDCTFDNYNNAICGVNNGGDSTTEITGCTFTNIDGEAIGYVTSSMPADFESAVIANNTGLTAENVIGY